VSITAHIRDIDSQLSDLFGKSVVQKIDSSALAGGGKLATAQNYAKGPKGKKEEKCGCGKSADAASCKCDDELVDEDATEKSMFVEIAKAVDEQQTVTGIVLQPEVTDAQGDIYDADVIRAAAYDYLANYNKSTKLGLQHKSFPKGKMDLVECYVAPIEFALGTRIVKAGSWVMTVKVLDSKLWAKVKDGSIGGFSIGGKAKVKDLTKTPGALK
jgi:hypothetical protein